MNGLKLALYFLAAIAGLSSAREIQEESKRIPKQINKGMILADDEEDRKAEGTGFESFGGFEGGGGEGGGGGGSKYFMYQHVPKKDHYEFGFKRGNEHHVKERHEKAHPHAGHFKTKVRWADKHGGHGEHYWDYNHQGHHGDEDEGGEADEASERVNKYEQTDEERPKRAERAKKSASASPGKDPSLIYNVEAKTVTDQTTGQVYGLYPIE